jgi:gliding motility-associated-like protein
MKAKRIGIGVSLLVLLSVFTDAQIFAPDAGGSFVPVYSTPGTDKVFVFNRLSFQQVIQASIKAVSPDSSLGWSFQWSVYNPSINAFTALPASGSSWFSVIDTITVSSGYQVTMTKGALNHTYRAWVAINDLNVSIVNKDTNDILLFEYYDCTSIDLVADTSLVPMFYYNPSTGEKIVVRINYTIRWTADNPEASLPGNRLITRVNHPPYEDTRYTVTLSDVYGLSRSDWVEYVSIQSKAVLAQPEYVNLSDETVYPEQYGIFYSDDTYSAPGKFRLDLSQSKNLASYTIKFGDGNEFVSDQDSLHLIHEYFRPGKYTIVLVTKSAKPDECIDSTMVQVELNYASFAMPNFFTPNEDGSNDFLTLEGSNDIFRSEDVSVIGFEITIFDRTGGRVHHYQGNIRDWKGWDGRIKDSNRQAPEGVYFYVISMLHAFEDKANPIGKEVYKGFIHLYRQ